MKKLARKLNEKPWYVQYSVLCLLNIVFYFLMSIPAITGYTEETRPVIAMVLYIAWLGFALSYGFFSIEIANSVVIGNLLLMVFGVVYCLICGNAILQIYTGKVILEKVFVCAGECFKYSLGAAVVSFVGKNTR